MLAVIADIVDSSRRWCVQCEWPSKKLSSQLEDFIGNCELCHFVEQCRVTTESNALLKSNDITITYGLSISRCVTVCL